MSAALEGYLALFAMSFAAATLLPLSSEAMLAGFAASGAFSATALWAVASLGNVGGAVVNWGLGPTLQRWKDRRWFPFTPAQLERTSRAFTRYGAWTLRFAWLPVIGSLPLLYLGITAHLGAVIGLGLFISSLASTQQQAIIGAFTFMAPALPAVRVRQPNREHAGTNSTRSATSS